MVRWMVQVLLLGVLLLTAATQDSEEHKKEEEEYFADVGDGRGPPQNVTVTASLTSLTVSWDPPDEPPIRYKVTVGSDIEQIAYDTSVVINNLQPCTTYIISVVSEYQDESSLPTYSSGTTLDSVPPPPQSCWFEDITNTTMTLYWQEADTECVITNHNISWSWDVLWSDEAGSGVTTNTGNHIRLRDLSPYTNVTAEVESYTDSGYGPSISCWDVTSQETPGAPVITSMTSSAQTLHVTWSPPDLVKGVIIQYSVNIKNEEGSSSISVNGSVTETEVKNLTKCSRYSVNVEAATEAGWGPPSQDQDTLIGGTVPPSDVRCNLVGDKVSVCWTPSPRECTDVGNVHYNINWHGDVLWSSDEVEDSDVMPWQEQQQCYQLPSSVPYTNYSVCVGVNNQVGDNGCCLLITPQAAPGPPVITEVTSEFGSAEVTWTPPEVANGVISEYQINFKNDKKPKTEGADGSMTSVTVTDLEECEDYVITVKAKTGLDWGDESDSYYTTINGIVAPSEVNCDQKGYTVNVCWAPSPASCSPKPTYIITWEGDMKWTDNNTHVAGSFSKEWENTSSLCQLLDTLVPYTEYIVDVSVSGYTNTDQRCSSSILVPDDAPGPPVLKDLLVTGTSLLVSWDHPRIENGIIGHYQVFWEDTAGNPDNSQLDGTANSYTILDLSRCETYTVTVSAETSGGKWGNKSEEKQGSIPNELSEVLCTLSNSQQVRLDWTLEGQGCSVSQYFLKWTTTVIWAEKESENSTTLEGTRTSLVLDNLPPYSDISACINVVNGLNNVHCCSDTTEEAKATAPTSLRQDSSTKTEVTISWSPPTQMNGLLQNWHISWYLNNILINQSDISAILYIFVISDLQPSTGYVVNVMAQNGAGLGTPASLDISTEPDQPPKQKTGWIYGVAAGCFVLLVIIVIGGVIGFKRMNKKGDDNPPIAMSDVSRTGNTRINRPPEPSTRFSSIGSYFTIGRRSTPSVYSSRPSMYSTHRNEPQPPYADKKRVVERNGNVPTVQGATRNQYARYNGNNASRWQNARRNLLGPRRTSNPSLEYEPSRNGSVYTGVSRGRELNGGARRNNDRWQMHN